jgi:hypothetical protein
MIVAWPIRFLPVRIRWSTEQAITGIGQPSRTVASRAPWTCVAGSLDGVTGTVLAKAAHRYVAFIMRVSLIHGHLFQ